MEYNTERRSLRGFVPLQKHSAIHLDTPNEMRWAAPVNADDFDVVSAVFSSASVLPEVKSFVAGKPFWEQIAVVGKTFWPL